MLLHTFEEIQLVITLELANFLVLVNENKSCASLVTICNRKTVDDRQPNDPSLGDAPGSRHANI